MMVAGISGGSRNGTVALAESGRVLGVCSQERVTRARGAGVNASGVPDQALDLLLARLGCSTAAIGQTVVADGNGRPSAGTRVEHLEHHLAHACTAYLTSPYASATIVVCDHEEPEVSVWVGTGPQIERVEWAWTGIGFARTFSRFSAALGLQTAAADQRTEALARLRPESRDARVQASIRLEDHRLVVDDGLWTYLADRLAGDHDPASPTRARLAAALQARLSDVLLDFLAQVRERVGGTVVCLGGSLFYHSSVNTRVRQAGVFTDVFVPVDPGDGGLAVGAALQGLGSGPHPVAPFMGPSYSAEETKEVLDNCKLQYAWESEEGAVRAAVGALMDGHMVGWFDGAMEWGPRALGARSILANPLAPYVLENLNRFLKQRQPWRGYALSGLQEAVHQYLKGPCHAPFMECDFSPRDFNRFREALPSAEAAVRVQTVSTDGGLPRFRRLLDAFGEASGLPFLINTSFNGFHEPIVCSPRDAVRVFYGSGIDVLVMGQFVLRK